MHGTIVKKKVTEIYCYGLMSHKLPARGTATHLLRSLQYALLEITNHIPSIGSPRTRKHQRDTTPSK